MKNSLICTVVCVLGCLVAANGAVIVQDQFDATYAAWTDTPQLGDPLSNWTDSDLGEGLGSQVHQSNAGDGGAGAQETVYTTDGSFIGNWTAMGPDGVQRVLLDFYADSGVGDGSPALLQVYFQDSGGQNWYYTLNPGGGWGYNFEAPVTYGLWTSDGPDDAASWLSSLGDVAQVGIYLAYQPGVNNQVYGIDNFTLDDAVNTPEPGTFLFLGVAFASMGVSFRKKLRECFAGLLKK